MASNSFGKQFRFTTWGESHGKALGVVIDGCPAGLPLDETVINRALDRRRPGKSPFTSPRQEPDRAELLSGVFEGVTTGAPLSIMIVNQDAKHQHYDAVKHILRPGHANFTYREKYGVFDHRGGGRASARETACRVAAGAVASRLLETMEITCCAYLQGVASQLNPHPTVPAETLKNTVYANPVYASDAQQTETMIAAIETAQAAGDSVGGVVGFCVDNLPVGLGEPVYDKIEARLASAMMSIPASKGFSIGLGYDAVSLRGSEHNDPFIEDDGCIRTRSNHAGGLLGGLTTGERLYGNVAFKPTSSIKQTQPSVTVDGQACELTLPTGSRHDPCVAIRAVPVVEAMAALVLADFLLLARAARVSL